jgi:ABC-type antimicrobial peptide transport system permease subunit
VLRNGSALVALGLVIGGVAAWWLSAAAKTFLFRIEATGPRAFAIALGLLALAAVIASLVPARRAATVDPMIALRAE